MQRRILACSLGITTTHTKKHFGLTLCAHVCAYVYASILWGEKSRICSKPVVWPEPTCEYRDIYTSQMWVEMYYLQQGLLKGGSEQDLFFFFNVYIIVKMFSNEKSPVRNTPLRPASLIHSQRHNKPYKKGWDMFAIGNVLCCFFFFRKWFGTGTSFPSH